MSQLRLRRRTRRVTAFGLKWACATVAPWALSAGVLVSFTAAAGPSQDSGLMPFSLVARSAPSPLSELEEGPSLLVANSSFRLPGLSLSASFRQAKLSFEEPEQRFSVDQAQPREDLKRSVSAFPEVDRSAKGDPLPALRPGLTRGLPARELEQVVFGDNQPKLISGGFTPEILRESAAPEAAPIGFEPYERDEGLTDPALSDASPSALRPAHETGEPPLNPDGATPAIPELSARSSATPGTSNGLAAAASTTPFAMAAAKPEAQLVTIAKAPAAPPAISGARKSDSGAKQDYTSLIRPENMAREQRCLAEAVYFEARSESTTGQAAVAQVVLNRVKSGLYPDSVCGVVYQNRHRYLGCQFTFACEGKSLRITEPGPWRDAVRIAREVYEGTSYLADVGASTHYHADYVRPSWARKLKKMDAIGRHVFYQLRPGQT